MRLISERLISETLLPDMAIAVSQSSVQSRSPGANHSTVSMYGSAPLGQGTSTEYYCTLAIGVYWGIGVLG